MEAKTWREANEVNPVSGYIHEEPELEIEDEAPAEEMDMSAKFAEPGRAKFPQLLASQPDYFHAWALFNDAYRHDNDAIEEGGIPWGAGRFEGWWTGSTGYDKYVGDAYPSPRKPITGKDIQAIAKDDPDEIFCMLSNIFYNETLSTGLTDDAIVAIVKHCFDRQDLDNGSYLEEYLLNGFEDEYPSETGREAPRGIKTRFAVKALKQKMAPPALKEAFFKKDPTDELDDVSEDEEGDVSDFEEPQFLNKVAGGVASASSYAEALKKLDDAYDQGILYDDEQDRPYVPTGCGAFEGWWTGSGETDAIIPSPMRRITLEDIKTLEREDPESLSSLFFNVFYNGSISRGFDEPAFEALVRWAVSGNDPFSDDNNQGVLEDGIPRTRRNRSGTLEGIDADGIIQRALNEFFDEEGEDELVEAARNGNKKAQEYLIETAIREYRFLDEAVDVDPESGYMFEEPEELHTNPISGYLSMNTSAHPTKLLEPSMYTDKPYADDEDEDIEEEEQGDVSRFAEPSAPPVVLEILKAPDYVSALETFSEEFEKFNTRAMTLIPYGSGEFEAWWCGKEPDPKRFPDAVASPHKSITKDDVRRLLRMSDGWGPTGMSAISLFSNIFYNSSLAKNGLDEETLEYLLEGVIKIAYSYDNLDEEGEVSQALATCINVEEAREIMDAGERITPFVKKEVREFLRNRA